MSYLRANFMTMLFLAVVSLLGGTQFIAYGADVSLSWSPNSESDLAGYKVYYGTSSHNYSSSVNVSKVTSYTLTGLNAGTYYFAVTAYDTAGNESSFSNEVPKTISSNSNPLPPPPPTSNGTLLVDFGSANGGDVFGVSGWNTVLRDVYTENRAFGPGGATIVVGDNHSYNFQGVSGTTRSFVSGEKIIVTWYNNSGSAITFSPGISFTDPDRRYSAQAGVWYDMATVTIPANATVQSQFLFTTSNAGSYSLVNVNNNFQNTQVLICDKMELVGQTQPPSTSLLPAPTNVKVK
ncbi:MAG: fibronectin type III domain-containing protein [Acidobacteria bacterium]|nr:fibronectin type III domain-containing protein [Acidobacteriota bacterium]MCI0718276.1 fibronectin type III domain-containing protein [Acidobacteriota bacterium]